MDMHRLRKRGFPRALRQGLCRTNRSRRWATLLAVVLMHLLAFWQLAQPWQKTIRVDPSQRTTLTFVRLVAAQPERAREPSTPAPPSHAIRSKQALEHFPQPTQDPQGHGIDWTAEAERAAKSFAISESGSPPTSNSIERENGSQSSGDSFHWDKTRTERIVALPQGGTLVRLSENCSLVITLLPIPGCRFGKLPARGDLFDGMNGPQQPGDWKDEKLP